MLIKNMAQDQRNSLKKSAANNTIMAPLNIFSQELGIKEKDFQLFDPSGLSKKNKLSAFIIYQLLNYLYRKSPLRYEFISSLPIAGIDGTLSERFQKLHPSYQTLIRAKTGFSQWSRWFSRLCSTNRPNENIFICFNL